MGTTVAADVLVIGAGLAGSATAIRLAESGAHVVIVDQNPAPPAPPSPRGGLVFSNGVEALAELGIDTDSLGRPISGLRLIAEHSLTRPLPSISPYAHRVIDDADLRIAVRRRLLEAVDGGSVEFANGWSAHTPIIERGFVRGADTVSTTGVRRHVRAGYTVIADGANSTFGRALGTFRQRSWPYSVSAGSVWSSPRHDDDTVEVALNLVDRAGVPITGFGWVLPRGDGTVGVGVTVLSTAPSFQVLTAERVLTDFLSSCRARWGLGDQPAVGVVDGRQPLGNSVAPVSGPTFLVVGDAGGFGNPIVGTGADTAIASGITAADVIAQALADGSSAPLQAYPRAVQHRTAGFYKVGRLSARMLGRPTLMRRIADVITQSPPAADAFVRIATGELRTRRIGVAELAYRAARALSVIAPEA